MKQSDLSSRYSDNKSRGLRIPIVNAPSLNETISAVGHCGITES